MFYEITFEKLPRNFDLHTTVIENIQSLFEGVWLQETYIREFQWIIALEHMKAKISTQPSII